MAQMEQNNTITPKQIEPFRPTSFQMPGPTGESPPCRVSRPCRAEPCPIPGGTLALKRIGSWPTKPILRGGADGAETARRRRSLRGAPHGSTWVCGCNATRLRTCPIED